MKLAAEVFDYEVAVSRLGGEQPLRDLAWEFLQLHHEHVCQIRRAIQSRDSDALANAARTLHRALGGISGARCRAYALALERFARTGAFDHATTTCRRLELGMADLVVALDCVVTPQPMN